MSWVAWFGVDPRGFNAASLAFDPPGGTGGAIAFAIALAVALVLSWRGVRSLNSRRRRFLLVALRGGALAALLLVALAPSVELRREGEGRRKVAVLVDLSQSMTIRDGPSGEARSEGVAGFFQKNARLFEKRAGDLEWIGTGFADKTRPLDLGRVLGSGGRGLPEPTGRRTDLARALHEAQRIPDLAGILLFTDGSDNAGLRSGGSEEEVGRALGGEIGVPVDVFQAGGGARLKDIAIARVRRDEFAFAKTPVEVEVEVAVTGYREKRFPLTLKRGDAVVSSREVDWKGDRPGRVRVPFEIVPEGQGTLVYTVEAPVFEDEAIPGNNRATFAIRVIRDKIRVLQIVGKPSWDERFLRDFLKSDVNVDLISFFILRTNLNQPEASQNELALIPFPVDELFTKELKGFDLVVFQNFAYGPYFANPMVAWQYLQNLRNYVLDGGAFVMIGGDQSFELGGYAGSPIEDILPVSLPPVAFAPATTPGRSEEYVMRLTAEGARHPITNLEGDPAGSEALWRSMPPLEGIHEGARPKPGSVVLGETPSGRQPVVVAAAAGKGRTLAVLTDSTWHWNFLAVGKGESNRTYLRFWRNALQWLTKDPRMKQVEVHATRAEAHEGEEVAARVRVLDEDYRPSRDAEVRLELIGPGGKAVPAQPVRRVGEGLYEAPLHPSEEGYQTVRATARRGGIDLGSDEDAFAYEADRPEWSDPRPAPDLLKALAKASGGSYRVLPASIGAGDIDLKEEPVREVQGRRREPIWDRLPLLVLPLLLLSAEWLLRRRWGLP